MTDEYVPPKVKRSFTDAEVEQIQFLLSGAELPANLLVSGYADPTGVPLHAGNLARTMIMLRELLIDG